MRVAVLIANIGSIDEVYPLAKQTEKYELFYFTENTLPFPLPNIDNRMKGKYFKTQAHKFLDHDVFIWIDGSIEVISTKFIKSCISSIEGVDLVISKHQYRGNVYDELVYIIDEMKAGNRYLLKRYARQPFYQEHDFYKSEGLPKDYPLYNCFFFARWNNRQANLIFDLWWDTILRFSNLDQTAFSYAAWKYQADIKVIEIEDLFIRNKHPGYNL